MKWLRKLWIDLCGHLAICDCQVKIAKFHLGHCSIGIISWLTWQHLDGLCIVVYGVYVTAFLKQIVSYPFKMLSLYLQLSLLNLFLSVQLALWNSILSVFLISLNLLRPDAYISPFISWFMFFKCGCCYLNVHFWWFIISCWWADPFFVLLFVLIYLGVINFLVLSAFVLSGFWDFTFLHELIHFFISC